MARHLVIMLALVLGAFTGRGWTQGTDPYATIDPLDTSTSILRRSLGPQGASILLETFDDRDVPHIERLLDAQLDHPSPLMRTTAATRLIRRGSPPLAVIQSLDSIDERSAVVVDMLASGNLTKDVAQALVKDVSISEFARTLALLQTQGDDVQAELRAITRDSNLAPVARGIAAAGLTNYGEPSLEAWLETLDAPSDAARDRAIFDVIASTNALGLPQALLEFDRVLGNRPADDALRAAAVIGLLEHAPAQGMAAWTRLAEETNDEALIPVGFLLVTSERPCPPEFIARITSSDRMQIAIQELLAATPEARPANAIPLIELGHPATMRWLGELEPSGLSPETMEAFLETASRRPTAIRLRAAVKIASALADDHPQRFSDQLDRFADDAVASEVLLRGLIGLQTPGPGTMARGRLNDSNRSIRAIALVAVATNGVPTEADWRRLVKIAGGGGGLPSDLRPMAAWYHLASQDAIAERLPTITAP